MSDDTTIPGYTDDEMRVLACVLDEVIPPSNDGRLPGAGQVGVAAYVDRALRALPDLRGMVTQGLTDLDAIARTRHGRRFTELPDAERRALVGEQGFVFPLTLHTYVGYYQHPQIVAALGLETRPPHPGGYTMEPNDLGLLEAVQLRPKFFRDC